jgi:hypothetical protein
MATKETRNDEKAEGVASREPAYSSRSAEEKKRRRRGNGWRDQRRSLEIRCREGG